MRQVCRMWSVSLDGRLTLWPHASFGARQRPSHIPKAAATAALQSPALSLQQSQITNHQSQTPPEPLSGRRTVKGWNPRRLLTPVSSPQRFRNTAQKWGIFPHSTLRSQKRTENTRCVLPVLLPYNYGDDFFCAQCADRNQDAALPISPRSYILVSISADG